LREKHLDYKVERRVLRELRTQVNRGHPFNKVRKFVRFMVLVALFTTVVAPLCSQAAGERKLEVFSWWTSGGEAAALDVLFKVYKKQNPGVEIINATVAGGAGFAARPVLQTRLAGGNPPDTWQTHPGQELLDQYVGP
jgi:ABC-type glycerol-3-phosphate transport system substrate-binding protein